MGPLCWDKDSKWGRKRYSRKLQRLAVERMRTSDNIGDLAKELRVGRSTSGKPDSITSSQERKHQGRIPMNLLTDSKSIG